MEKPHICFISESLATYSILAGEACSKVGGAEVQQTVLAAQLLKLGYKVSFAVGDYGQAEKVITEEGITLVKIRKLRTCAVPGPTFIDEIIRIHRAMSCADADIYYQRAGGHVTGIASLYGHLHCKPFVFSVAHNNDLDGSARVRFSWHYNQLYQYGLRNAKSIVLQTDDQAELLKRNIGREGVLIRSTFDQPDAQSADLEKHTVLWVGNFKKIKRPEIFLDLALRLPQHEFVMVGGAGEGEENLLLELSKRAEAIPNLRMVGAAPYCEVGNYFAQSKLFVNTSLDEGFPNTYLQAWCRGVPVIGTFDADNLISRYGLGKKCDDLDGLVSAVDELMKNDELRGKIGKTARLYVDENHSPERVAAKYDKLFLSLVVS